MFFYLAAVSMTATCFLVLGGGDMPARCDRVLRAISEQNVTDYQIVCTGRANYQLNPVTIESEVMRAYLIDKGVAPELIVIEDEALDTLGNMVLSVPVVQAVGECLGGEKLTIALCSEAFHLPRVSRLATRVLLPGLADSISTELLPLAAGRPAGVQQLIADECHELLELLYDRHHAGQHVHDLFAIMHDREQIHLLERVKQEILAYDIAQFDLHTYEDYLSFVRALPVYRDLWGGATDFPIQQSLYAQAVSYQLAQRAHKKTT